MLGVYNSGYVPTTHLENVVMRMGTTTTIPVYNGLKCKSTPSRGATLDYGKIL